MADHLTPQQLERFPSRALPAHELLAVDDHLSACEDCRRKLTPPPASAADGLLCAIAGPGVSDHPLPQELARFAGGSLVPAARARIEQHVNGCEACREDVADLRAFQPTAQPPRRRWLAPAAAIAAALLIGIGIFNATRPGPKAQPAPMATSTPAPSALPADDRALVAQVRETGALPFALPEPLGRTAGDTVRGPGAPASPVTLLSPVRESVRSSQPTLRWTPIGPGARYTVELFDARYHPVLRADSASTDWTVPKPLRRGQVYSWQVTARWRGKTYVIPQSPAPEARFFVLPETEAARLDALAQRYPQDHLLLAARLAQAGLRTDALSQLGTLAETDPQLAANLRAGLAR